MKIENTKGTNKGKSFSKKDSYLYQIETNKY